MNSPLVLRLILGARMVPWWFLRVQFMAKYMKYHRDQLPSNHMIFFGPERLHDFFVPRGCVIFFVPRGCVFLVPRSNMIFVFVLRVCVIFLCPKRLRGSGKNSKTQMVMNFKNSNCGKTQKLKLWEKSKTQMVIKHKLKLWWNSKIQIVTNLENSHCDETQKLRQWWNSTQIGIKPKKLKLLWNSKTQIGMKLKDPNCDETENLKLWCNSKRQRNSKTPIVTKLKNSNYYKTQIVTKFKNSKYDKTQIVTKFKNLKFDKTQIKTKLKLWQNLNYDNSSFMSSKKTRPRQSVPNSWS